MKNTPNVLKGSIAIGLLLMLALVSTLSISSPVATADEEPNRRVLVLVVDDFRPTHNPDGTLKSHLSDEESCMLNVAGAGFTTHGTGLATRGAWFATRGAWFATRGAGFATRGVDGNLFIPESHGDVIYAQLEELDFYYGNGYDIDIIKVQWNNYNVEKLKDAIDKAINDNDDDYGYFVVNMSFAILPCDVVNNFNQYLNELEEDEYYDKLEDAGKYLEELLEQYSGDHYQYENIIAGRSNVIGVASVGNFGLDFPFYPATWDGVIGVSGSDDYNDFYASSPFNNSTQAPLLGWDDELVSNYGEVMMPGQYLDIIGTSYAAPRLSYVIAMYLHEVGVGYCTNDDGYIALDYSTNPNSGNNRNLTLQEVADQHCPDLNNYLPAEMGYDTDGDGYQYFVSYQDIETSPYITYRGTWTFESDPAMSNGTYLVSSGHPIDHIEADFAGPYLELLYVDGVVEGEIDVYINDVIVAHLSLSTDGEARLVPIDFSNLGEGNHTLEIYATSGQIAVDSIYSMFEMAAE